MGVTGRVAGTRPAPLMVDAVCDWCWQPDEAWEGDQPLRIVRPGDRMTGVEMRPDVHLAGVLGLDGRVQSRGHMRVLLWQMKRGHEAPPPESREYRLLVTLDGTYHSIVIRSAENGWCRGVRAYFGLAKMIGEECVCDGKSVYALSVLRVDD